MSFSQWATEEILSVKAFWKIILSDWLYRVAYPLENGVTLTVKVQN